MSDTRATSIYARAGKVAKDDTTIIVKKEIVETDISMDDIQGVDVCDGTDGLVRPAEETPSSAGLGE